MLVSANQMLKPKQILGFVFPCDFLRIVPSQITIVKQHMGGMLSHLFQASYKQIQGFMFGLEIMFLEF